MNALSKLKLEYANKIDGIGEVSPIVKKLNYTTTSGLQLEVIPGKTTTVLGRYENDTKHILGS